MHAFGLEIRDAPVPGLHEGPPRPRSLDTEVVETAAELDAGWPAAEAERLLERRLPDGRLVVSVWSHAGAGYRFEAPDHGLHVLSPDGRRLRSWLPSTEPWRWQRLLFAQVLPVAATLQGLELIHASAVVLGERLVAVAAPSGQGKSSVALQLVARGATPFTDDVLTLEVADDRVVAHPGPRFASAHRAELDALPAKARARAGRVVGESDKLHLEPPAMLPDPDPVPPAALWLLDRGAHERLRPVPVTADLPLLAAQLFVGILARGPRLGRILDVLATLARDVPIRRLEVPGGAGSAAAAEVIASETH